MQTFKLKAVRATAVAVALAFSPMAANAVDHAAFEFSAITTTYTNGSWNFGINFDVINTVTVTGLGYYEGPIYVPHQVALFDSSGTQLAISSIDSTDGVMGHFRYHAVNSFAIGPGRYQLVGVSQNDDYTWNATGFTIDPNLSYVGNQWQLASSNTNPNVPDFMTFGAQNDVSNGYWGPDLRLAGPIPEPETYAMLLAGLGLMGFVARRRQRKLAAA
jgi:hypothetical protein